MRLTRAWPVLLLLGGLFTFIPVATATNPGDFFATEATFGGVTWQDVYGATATNVWAVGGTPSTGAGSLPVIAERIAGVWTIETSAAGFGPLFSVWAADATHAWAGGNGTVGVQHLVSGVWVADTLPLIGGTGAKLTSINSIHGTSSSNIYAVGVYIVSSNGVFVQRPVVFLWNGSAWSLVYSGSSADDILNRAAIGLWALGVDYFFSVTAVTSSNGARGGNGGVNKYDAAPGGTSPVGGTQTAAGNNQLWGTSTTNMWSVGFNGQIEHCTALCTVEGPPSAWTPVLSPTPGNLFDIWGNSASDIWAVGNPNGGPAIIHYDGISWSAWVSTISGAIYGVWCFNTSTCWVVAQGGQIQKLTVVTAVGPPTLAIAVVHSEDMDLETEGAPCLGFNVPFNINVELPSALITLSDGDIWIYSKRAGFWVQDLDDSTWQVAIPAGATAQWFGTSTFLPPGEYYALAILDLSGVGAADVFDGNAFTVTQDACDNGVADLSQVINHIDYNQAQENVTQTLITNVAVNVTEMEEDVDHIESNTVGIWNTLNTTFPYLGGIWGRVNQTCRITTTYGGDCEGLGNFLGPKIDEVDEDVDHVEDSLTQYRTQFNATNTTINEMEVDVDATESNLESFRTQFNTSYAVLLADLADLDHHAHLLGTYINATNANVLHNHVELHNILDNNFTCANCSLDVEPMSLIEFPGMDSPSSTIMLFFLVLMIWALWECMWFLAGGALLGALAVFIPWTTNVGGYEGIAGTAIGIGMVILTIWIERIVKNKRLALQEDTPVG